MGRRLARVGRVELNNTCFIYTSARRYKALGRLQIFWVYLANFLWETVCHRPKDFIHEDVRL